MVLNLPRFKSENVHVKSVREFGGWKNVTRQLQAAQITGPSRQFYNKGPTHQTSDLHGFFIRRSLSESLHTHTQVVVIALQNSAVESRKNCPVCGAHAVGPAHAYLGWNVILVVRSYMLRTTLGLHSCDSRCNGPLLALVSHQLIGGFPLYLTLALCLSPIVGIVAQLVLMARRGKFAAYVGWRRVTPKGLSELRFRYRIVNARGMREFTATNNNAVNGVACHAFWATANSHDATRLRLALFAS